MSATPVRTASTTHAPSIVSPRAFARFALSFNLVRFLAAGSIGFAIDTGMFAGLAHQGVSEPRARALSIAAATIVTWQLNRRFTFGDSSRHAALEGGLYTGVALAAVSVNYLTFLTLRAHAPDLSALAAIVCGAVLAAIVSYAGQRFLTFRGSVRG